MKKKSNYFLILMIPGLFAGCAKNLGPIAAFTMDPEEGTTTTEFILDASNSRDLSTPAEQLLYRWDWEGDGVFDTDFSFQPSVLHIFPLAGEKKIILEVTDQQGETALESRKVTIGEGSHGLFKDNRDNQLYQFRKIGAQTWMAQNLNFNASGGSFIYNEDPLNAGIYGRLYTWETSRNVCPAGWHLPTDTEWMQLEKFATMMTAEAEATGCRGNQGMYLKSDTGWPVFTHYNFNGNNETGFTGLPAGYYRPEAGYNGHDYAAIFWSSTETDSGNAWSRRLVTSNEVCRDPSPKVDGYSVRCVRD
jgi:uncharacterized protein (TIGR02145 family)